VKTYGNIVCFRNLQKETDDAISLFGDRNASGIVLLKSYKDYYDGYADEDGKAHKGYAELVDELNGRFPLGQPIVGEQDEKDFIALYGAILRMRNILTAFDSFEGHEILSERDFQDYQSVYLDLHDKWKPKTDKDKEDINDDIVFEMELVRQVEINIDYILMLVVKYHNCNCQDKSILVDIRKAVSSSEQLRSKRQLIENFVETVNSETDVNNDWHAFVREQKEKDLTTLIGEEHLKEQETRKLVDDSFSDGSLKTTGTDVDQIMPPVSRFGKNNDRTARKMRIIDKLKAFFEKYFGIA
jgi:type I restriction enzyme R subunit